MSAKIEGSSTSLGLNPSLNLLYTDSHHTPPVKGMPDPCENSASLAPKANSIATDKTKVYASTHMETNDVGYEVETSSYRIGAATYRIRTLLNRQQFSDPDGCAERAGISSASWPLFGIMWPSGLALAEEMSRFPIKDKHILEVGCGIGFPSVVLQQRGADITSCDYHPLAEAFLRHNTNLNGLAPIPFFNAPWLAPSLELGRFDLIIGSDLLYERDHPSLLAGFLADHARPTCQILLADPGRHRGGQFSSQMATQGYTRTESPLYFTGGNMPCLSGRLLSFIRTHG